MRTKVFFAALLMCAMAAYLWGNPQKSTSNDTDLGPNTCFLSVAFSADGHTIYATGFEKPGTFTVTQWNIAFSFADQ